METKETTAKIGFVSLGCPKNQVDTERMLAMLAEAGFTITPEEIEADIIVVNTCAFIESAKQESIGSILDLGWLKENRHLKGIIVTGCLAERYRDEIFRELPEVDAVLGVGSYGDIVTACKKVLKGRSFSSYGDKNEAPMGGERILTTPPYMAYLKIAEGCDNRCTYCAIPDIRGKFRSRPMEELVEEAVALERSGVKELNIVAQDTSRYGLDLYGEYRLAELVQKILDATRIPWIRLLYCYPDKITDELIQVMAGNERVCRYIDLPIQHIDDAVLRRMNRHGGAAVIRDALTRLRAGVPGITVRTTAIVGFPGETKEQFERLCDYITEARFEHFGAFAYSREEDTPAYAFDCQIDEQEKQDRYDIIMREAERINEERLSAKVGATVTVLVEGWDAVGEAFYGRTEADAPDIDGKVYFTDPVGGVTHIPLGEMVQVRITEQMDYDLVGELCVRTKGDIQ